MVLGTELNDEIKIYIKAVRELGGVITTSITIAAVVRQSDLSIHFENGGPINLTATNWASKSLLYIQAKICKKKRFISS